MKQSTRDHLNRAKSDLIDCCGSETPLAAFTVADGERFTVWLTNKGLSNNTVRRRCGRAKQFFANAVDREILARNPFAGVKSTVQANKARYHFVTREVPIRC